MSDVTFVSPNGQVVAEFTRQTSRQVQLLLAHPPHCAKLCNAEIRVRPA